MKKLFLSLAFTVLYCGAYAQEIVENKEGESEIASLDDIIRVQQELRQRETYSTHMEQVWGRGGFFNFVFQRPVTLTITEPIAAEPSMIGHRYTAKFGVAIQSGRAYKLHKKPIANILSFNLDYLPLDLYANNYEADKGTYLYDSRIRYKDSQGNSCHARAWGLTKWEFNYSMSIGPSITIAPFVPIKNFGLDFIKINAYFHVGYSAALFFLVNDPSKDKNTEDEVSHLQMANDFKADFGHGMYISAGGSLSWKAIGVGFEYRSGTSQYMAIGKNYGSDKYKMFSEQYRMFLNLRF